MIICDRRVVAIGCCAIMMTWASTALAQDPNPQAPFDEARVLMKSGRYAEALPKLEESLFIKVTGGALLNYADCLEKLGRYASAVDAFDRARTIFEETKDARRADEAKTRAATLRPVLSTITVKSTTKDISVVIGRKTVTPNTPVPVDGGEHAVTVVASCHKPLETKVTVALRGDAKEVVADLAPTHECGGGAAATPPPPPPPPAKTAPPPAHSPPVVKASSPSTSSMPPLAIASGVVGVVGIGLGTFFGLRASSTKDDLDAACTSYPTGCPSLRRTEIEELASDANTQAVVSTIGFIAGAAFLAGAVVLYVTAPKRSSRTGFAPSSSRAGIVF